MFRRRSTSRIRRRFPVDFRSSIVVLVNQGPQFPLQPVAEPLINDVGIRADIRMNSHEVLQFALALVFARPVIIQTQRD